MIGGLIDNIEKSKKTIILIEKEAILAQATKPTSHLSSGVEIHFTSDIDSYYIKVKPSYTINMSGVCFSSSTDNPLLTPEINGVNRIIQTENNEPNRYILTLIEKKI